MKEETKIEPSREEIKKQLIEKYKILSSLVREQFLVLSEENVMDFKVYISIIALLGIILDRTLYFLVDDTVSDENLKLELDSEIQREALMVSALIVIKGKSKKIIVN